jgi:hypothetical protein
MIRGIGRIFVYADDAERSGPGTRNTIEDPEGNSLELFEPA